MSKPRVKIRHLSNPIMKLKLFLSLFLVVSLFLGATTNAHAETCASLSGQCIPNTSACDAASERPEPLGGCPPIGGGKFQTPQICCVAKTQAPPSCSNISGVCKSSCDLLGGETDRTKRDCSAGTTCCVKSAASSTTTDAYCDSGKGINTALGCISFDAEGGGFVRSLLGIIIGLGGGVALLLILYGVFIVTTSAGIPDKLNQGKEIISSAVAGLVFIILAIFLMQLIGVQILVLPGL